MDGFGALSDIPLRQSLTKFAESLASKVCGGSSSSLVGFAASPIRGPPRGSPARTDCESTGVVLLLPRVLPDGLGVNIREVQHDFTSAALTENSSSKPFNSRTPTTLQFFSWRSLERPEG